MSYEHSALNRLNKVITHSIPHLHVQISAQNVRFPLNIIFIRLKGNSLRRILALSTGCPS